MEALPRRRRGVTATLAVAVGALLAATVAFVVTRKDDEGDGEGDTAGTTTVPTAGNSPGDGVWDFEPGRYIAAEIGNEACGWARLAGDGSVIAGESGVREQAIVDILDGDAAFRTGGCGTWVLYVPPAEPPATSIGEGDWVVGEQIEPGVYQVAQAATCAWTRAQGFEHTPAEEVQTERTNLALEGPYSVTLTAGERFSTRGCEAWAKAS